MHREALLQLLRNYDDGSESQREVRDRMAAFVRAHERCFERHLTEGHITGSAWLVNSAGDRVLLTHHRKLDRWLQLGGHADGDPRILEVAIREAREESGIADIEPLSDEIFDVDIHEIPSRGETNAHLHYDVRFLLRVACESAYRVSDESHDLAWVSPAEFEELETDHSVRRLMYKWRAQNLEKV